MICRLSIVIAAALTASAALGQGGGVKVATESFDSDGSLLRVNFSVENGSPTLIRQVFVDCTFFDAAKKPVVTQVGIVSNVTPQEKAFGTVRLPVEKEIQTASCRFSRASN